MNFNEVLKLKEKLSKSWMDITDDEANAVATAVCEEINKTLPGLLPEGVVFKGGLTPETVLSTLTNDRWFWNGQENAPGLYYPIDYLVNFLRGTRNVVTSQMNVLDMKNTIRVASLGDTVGFKGGAMSGIYGQNQLIEIDANGTDFLMITVRNLGCTSSVRSIVGNYSK